MVILKEINEFNDLKQVVKNAKPETFFNLKIDLTKNDRINAKKLALIDNITKNFSVIKSKIKYINLYVPYEKIPKKEFGHLYKLYKKTKDQIPCYVNVKHRYIDDDKFQDEKYAISWDLGAVIKANTGIEKVCDFIKKNRLSPFEALAFIHNYVSNVANYKTSNLLGGDWFSKDQFFVGAYLDLPEVVCAGYSSLMKEIIDNLNMPELKCEIISVSFEHLEKDYYAKHARCLIEIQDKKYGLNQTVFDDPTWDNDSNSNCSKYTHFALRNDIHDISVSKLYDYHLPYIFKFSDKKRTVEYCDFNPYRSLYNKSKNKIDQKMIETAYVNIMHKACLNKSPTEIYDDLKQIAKLSFKEQQERKFQGNLSQSNPVLTKKEVFGICGKNLTKEDEKELTL